ncbi:MAG: cob(I)yrinic acid a,c-diamide adenosyltransferase [Polyangiaceae bacterium]
MAKDDPRIEAYGTVDELNAVVGAARQTIVDVLAQPAQAAPGADGRGALEALGASLLRVQHELFNLGSLLATLPADVHERQPRVTAEDVTRLEREMDASQKALAPLRSFVLPGGSRLCVELHLARTVCRRAERLVVALARQGGAAAVSVEYLNRLGDAFFVWSRAGNRALGREEVLWDPNWAAPGKDPAPGAA